MTMRSLGGPLLELPVMAIEGGIALTTANPVMDAVNESIQCIGEVYLQAGSGSKTISSAGGKIHWRTGAVTWATAGTTIRVGIQNVSTTTSPAQGDTTFGVYADLVQGVDALTATSVISTPMTNLTKTINHGDLVAVVFSMTVRNGADSVVSQHFAPGYAPISYQMPVVMLGAPTFSRQNGVPNIIIEFDDGTIGWFVGSCPALGASVNITYNVNTVGADEYGNILIPNVPVRAVGFTMSFQPASVSADFEVCMYEDPLGAATLVEAKLIDATQLGNSANNSGTGVYLWATPKLLKPGTAYGITIRPTTTGNMTIGSTNVMAASNWQAMLFDGTCHAISRVDNTGSFVDSNGGTAQTRRVSISFLVDQFNDNSSSANYLIGI